MTRASRTFCLCFLPFVWGEISALAQIGPYPGGPYPGGGYPPGGYPGGYPGGGGVGLPMPGRRGKKKDSKQDTQPTQTVTGMLRSLRDDKIVLEAEDTRIISLKRTAKTKFLKDGDPMKPADLTPGDHLEIDATQDDQGYFTAVNVNFAKAGNPSERAAASQPVEVPILSSGKGGGGGDDDDDRPRIRRADSPQQPAPEAAPEPTPAPPARASAPAPTPAPRSAPAPEVADDKPLPPAQPDADDPGPPKLRRGRPTAARTSSAPTQVASARAPASVAAQNEDRPVEARPTITQEQEPVPAPEAPAAVPIIVKATEAAETFTETLPNYVVQQFTSRFASNTHVVNWVPQDVVSAEVVYENGREDYRNLKINNKPVKKGSEEANNPLMVLGSTGEFGTLLRDLFSPATAADFRFRKDSNIAGVQAALYDFTVEHSNSHWQIIAGGQAVLPAYKGSVWIDKKNGRVMRIEMQSRNMPAEFPLDHVESAADYEYVRIGGTQQFLLPVHSENLSCQRGTNNCSRSSIDFRNYRKYSGEANITFDK